MCLRSTVLTFLEAVEWSPCLLSVGGIETRIAFETDIPLDPEMGVARLVEDERGREELERIYRQYLNVGRRHDIPMQVGTETLAPPPGLRVSWCGGGPSSFARGRDLGPRETCPTRSDR
jgi:hypothetical protein